jgi:hypothetical protein
MFSYILILQILFIHWISDFVFQSGWMATNKSKNWLALGSHVLVYTASMGVLLIFSSIIVASVGSIPGGAIMVITPLAFMMWIALNGVLHFITDAVTSRITAKLWKKNDMHNFFVVVGFDQFIHYTCLIVTLLMFI